MQTAEAVVDSRIRIRGLDARTLELISWALSFQNDAYERAKRAGRWLGNIPKRIEAAAPMINDTGQCVGVSVPRGSVSYVREHLRKHGYELGRPEDWRIEGAPITRAMPHVELWDYQTEGVRRFVERTQGLIVLPCGCGKTRLGIAAIGAIKRAALVVVPTGDLADQWVEGLREHLGIEAGVLGGGKKSIYDADVVVAVEDSLAMFLSAHASADHWVLHFGVLIVDESHHVPSLTLQNICNRIPAKWRLGLTASPFREDGCDQLIEWTFGDKLLERSTAEMIKLGYLSGGEIEVVETGWRFEWDGDEDHPDAATKKSQDTEAALAMDLGRNAIVRDLAVRDARAGETVLVLCGRKDQAADIAEMIESNGVRAVGVTSKTARGKRRKSIADFKEGELSVLVATSLADEGLDVRRLSRIIVAFPHKARAKTTQQLGRMLRKFEGKKPKLYDLVDDVESFLRRARERMRVYRESGLVIGEATRAA